MTAIERTAALDALLGKGAGLPAWLDPEAFLKSDFDADAYVADLRRYVSAMPRSTCNACTMISFITLCHSSKPVITPRART